MVVLLDPFVFKGHLRVLASLDVRVPPGPPRFPIREMFHTARAMKFAKHKVNELAMSEQIYHDLMFSLGTGAAIKHSVDITSEFELLPGATIKIDQSMDDINDLGHASHSATPVPTDNREKASKAVIAEETFFDELAKTDAENLDLDLESDHADVPEGAVLTPVETAAVAEMERLKTALASAS